MIDRHHHGEIIDAVLAGDEVWVKIDKGARAGSVGLITEVKITHFPHSRYAPRVIDWVTVAFPRLGKKPATMIRPDILTLHTGPAVWCFTKKKKDREITQKPIRDIFQQNISVGDLVIYQSRYGVVNTIDYRTGFCTVGVFPVLDDQHSFTVTVRKPDRFLSIVNPHLADNILVARMTHEGMS